MSWFLPRPRPEDPRRNEFFKMGLSELTAHARSGGYLERGYAAQALGRLNDPAGLAILERLVLDEEDVVRADALVALIETAGARAAPACARALRDASALVRQVAAEGLEKNPGAAAADELAALLDDSDEAVRLAAACALSARRDPRALPPLLAELAAGKERFRALNGLRQAGDRRAIPAAQRFFRRWFVHPLERMAAAAVLVRFGDPAGEKYLRRCLRQPQLMERGYAIELCGGLPLASAMPELQQIARDRRDLLRGNALRALAQARDPAALELARAALDDPDEEVRADAIQALAQWGGREAFRFIEQQRLRETSEEVLRACREAVRSRD